MLVWLASYPRSGNTFTRVILKNVFHLNTHTIIGAKGDSNFIDKADVMEIVGASRDETSGDDLIQRAASHDGQFIIKTHDAPQTSDATIYIIRDGRSSIISFYHFIKRIGGIDYDIDRIIKGDVFAGSWSQHLEAWSPDTRNNTIIVRYEELVHNPELVIKRISEFLGIMPAAEFNVKFSDLHSKYPEFFRIGSDKENIGELELIENSNSLFWEMHGAMMARFGYSPL